jgi:hypothetical protein
MLALAQCQLCYFLLGTIPASVFQTLGDHGHTPSPLGPIFSKVKAEHEFTNDFKGTLEPCDIPTVRPTMCQVLVSHNEQSHLIFCPGQLTAQRINP